MMRVTCYQLTFPRTELTCAMICRHPSASKCQVRPDLDKLQPIDVPSQDSVTLPAVYAPNSKTLRTPDVPTISTLVSCAPNAMVKGP